jgi:hypothetical protein
MSREDEVRNMIDAQMQRASRLNDATPDEWDRASALSRQVGGEHYKDRAVQPIEYIEANELPFLEGCVVKRVTRHNQPTGKGEQDINKAIHELQLIKELRYGKR